MVATATKTSREARQGNMFSCNCVNRYRASSPNSLLISPSLGALTFPVASEGFWKYEFSLRAQLHLSSSPDMCVCARGCARERAYVCVCVCICVFVCIRLCLRDFVCGWVYECVSICVFNAEVNYMNMCMWICGASWYGCGYGYRYGYGYGYGCR